MSLGVDFIPLVKLEEMHFLSEKDKLLLSNTPYFLLSIKSKKHLQQLDSLVLFDTNQELKINDLVIAGDKLASLEIFQFIYEIKNQRKIKVRSLHTDKKSIKDLNNFIIYGVLTSDR